jgi:hypothetical protein
MRLLHFIHALQHRLWRRILLDDVLDLLLVGRPILLEQVERISLRRRLRVRLVEQRLYAQQNLLDRNRRLPAFFFVEDGQTDGAGGVDVGVEQRGNEFA